MEVLIAACLTYSFLIGSCGCVNEWLRDGVLARGEREREREREGERERERVCLQLRLYKSMTEKHRRPDQPRCLTRISFIG